MTDLAAVEFAVNPEARCACVLLLDTSGSMGGAPIAALNQGLIDFARDLSKDGLAAKRVEVAIVTFDSEVKVVQDFVTAGQFQPPYLSAGGGTDMGSGIVKALEILDARKAQYKTNGVSYYRPWIFMITDGAPNAGFEPAAARLQKEEQNKRVAFFAVGVEGADVSLLSRVSARPPRMLKGLEFGPLFEWLSASMKGVSQSRPGDQVALPAADWASV